MSESTEQELARSQALLRALPDALFEISAEGEYLFCHAAPGTTYASPVVGKYIRELLPESVASLAMSAVKRALRTGATQVIQYSLPGPDKRHRYFQTSIGPTNANTSVVAIVRDITEDVTHRQALEAQKKHLEDANASLEQFVYVASHDLREPLTGVAGYASLLLRRHSEQLDKQGQHFLEAMMQSCRKMEAKIDDLLALSRAGRTLRNAPFSLEAALEEAKRSLSHVIRKTDATLLCPEGLPIAVGDRSCIAQVFQNLISNSLKYQRPGVAPVIEVTAQRTDAVWTVAVKDNGIGFDMKHAGKIFGVFQRICDDAEQYPGTGIGLAIVKKIIDKHNGRVWVESTRGEGATFFFTVPVSIDDD